MTERFTQMTLTISRQDVPGTMPGFRAIIAAYEKNLEVPEEPTVPLHVFVFQRELVNPASEEESVRFQDYFVGVASSIDYQELVVGAPAAEQADLIGAKYRYYYLDLEFDSADQREQAIARIVLRLNELIRAHLIYADESGEPDPEVVQLG